MYASDVEILAQPAKPLPLMYVSDVEILAQPAIAPDVCE